MHLEYQFKPNDMVLGYFRIQWWIHSETFIHASKTRNVKLTPFRRFNLPTAEASVVVESIDLPEYIRNKYKYKEIRLLSRV